MVKVNNCQLRHPRLDKPLSITRQLVMLAGDVKNLYLLNTLEREHCHSHPATSCASKVYD